MKGGEIKKRIFKFSKLIKNGMIQKIMKTI